MEEDLWTQKALVTNVHLERLLRNRVDAFVLLDPLLKVIVVFAKFLYYVWANVGEFLLPSEKHNSTNSGSCNLKQGCLAHYSESTRCANY